MTITLRSAEQADAPEIAQILSDWIDETNWMPRIHTRQQDQCFGQFLITKTKVTVARGHQEVLGFAAMHGTELQALYLKRSMRGQGLGARFLRHLKERNASLSLWCFQSNRPARHFYRSNGFQEIGRSDGQGNDEKLPDVRYHWAKANQGRML